MTQTGNSTGWLKTELNRSFTWNPNQGLLIMKNNNKKKRKKFHENISVCLGEKIKTHTASRPTSMLVTSLVRRPMNDQVLPTAAPVSSSWKGESESMIYPSGLAILAKRHEKYEAR